MLITLTCHAPNAPEIGYLFGKNPASVFEREFSGGRVLVFYPEVADDHLTIALLTEIDPIALVRTASGAHRPRPVRQRPALRRLQPDQRRAQRRVWLGARRQEPRTARARGRA